MIVKKFTHSYGNGNVSEQRYKFIRYDMMCFVLDREDIHSNISNIFAKTDSSSEEK